MHPLDGTARVAGWMHLRVTASTVLGMMLLTPAPFVRGDGAATAARVLASQGLFRVSAVNGLFSMVSFLVVAIVLYRLLRDAGPWLATCMLVLVAVQTPVGLGLVTDPMLAFDVLRGGPTGAAFTQPGRESMALLPPDVDNRGVGAVELLWGLWLLPLALLVWRGGFLPRFLAGWLGLNGVAYVVLSVLAILWPQHSKLGMTVAFPLLFGELALGLWLALAGARRHLRATPSIDAGHAPRESAP